MEGVPSHKYQGPVTIVRSQNVLRHDVFPRLDNGYSWGQVLQRMT